MGELYGVCVNHISIVLLFFFFFMISRLCKQILPFGERGNNGESRAGGQKERSVSGARAS